MRDSSGTAANNTAWVDAHGDVHVIEEVYTQLRFRRPSQPTVQMSVRVSILQCYFSHPIVIVRLIPVHVSTRVTCLAVSVRPFQRVQRR